ncbi:hypothetical protein [Azospirillum doebereinerae]|uniref:Uncharacterized protein n=1 Tax=Azospirillum doebereinerae TaxID=92933 RepID=A0A3S0V3N0_9PROT|nr:hypothetical protein [Azospirillum doebereinerae]RUQ64000.1 hypothetical protein EJ913_27135 [Azospirillum doebereinerae]
MDGLIGEALAAGAGITHGDISRPGAAYPSEVEVERFRQKLAATLRELPEDMTVAELRDALEG